MTRLSDGVLGVTITGGQAAFSRLDVGMAGQPLNNATVDVAGNASSIQIGTSVSFNPGASRIDLQIRRVAVGQGATVQLTIVDACGSWPTFVGGGASAF